MKFCKGLLIAFALLAGCSLVIVNLPAPESVPRVERGYAGHGMTADGVETDWQDPHNREYQRVLQERENSRAACVHLGECAPLPPLPER